MADNHDLTSPSDDELLFADEEPSAIKEAAGDSWKILIVDDEEAVHDVTRMVLQDFRLDGREMTFVSAYSGEEARRLIQEHPDTALVLLDVVMEADHAGLELVKFIRDELKNQMVRLVLRTGQPGQAPEQDVVAQYDINDYREKTELTAQKLCTSVAAALRSYRDLLTIDDHRSGLAQVVAATAALFETRDLKPYADELLTQMCALLAARGSNGGKAGTSALAATRHNDRFKIIAGMGDFSERAGRLLDEALADDRIASLTSAASHHLDNIWDEDAITAHFRSQTGIDNITHMRRTGQPFSDLEKSLLELYFSNAAVAFDNLCLLDEIVCTQKEVILTLGGVVETRSKETANHVFRVGEFAHYIASLYGLNENECQLVRMAAPMHDVGKIGIADSILNKPGKLTPEEFEIMRTHTTIGYGILDKSDREIMRAAAIIALQHHERWDGNGYPQGLAGENIHIYGRILALVDVFDALGHDRVYKKAWPLDEIIPYMTGESGSAFDPKLIELFEAHIDDLTEIGKKYPNED